MPALIKPHGHGASKRLHPRRALVVSGTEMLPHVFIVQYLNFKGEIFLQVLDHDQEGKLDAQCFLRVSRACDPPPALRTGCRYL